MSSTVKVRSAFDVHKPEEFGVNFPKETLTKQSFRDECDINNIVSRWNKTGVVGSSFNNTPGYYGDVSNVADYHASLNLVLAATQGFNALPSSLRERFNNDPAQLLGFLDNPENRDEAIALGLVAKPSEATAAQPQELSAAGASEQPKAAPAASTSP